MRWRTMPTPFPLTSRSGARADGRDEGLRYLKGADEHTPRACERAAQRAGMRMTARGASSPGAASPAAVRSARPGRSGAMACIKFQPMVELPAGDRVGRDTRIGSGRRWASVDRIMRAAVSGRCRIRPEHQCTVARGAGDCGTCRAQRPGTAPSGPGAPSPLSSVPPRTMRRRLAVEAGATLSWRPDVDSDSRVIGPEDFGAADRDPQRLAQCGLTAGRLERHIGGRLGTAN